LCFENGIFASIKKHTDAKTIHARKK